MKIIVLAILYYLSGLRVQAQPIYAVVINEIMADPSPVVGLPEYEWIELYNTGDAAVNLSNWRLADGSSVSGAFPRFILAPKQYLIVCTAAARPAMEAYGELLVITSFPSLDNAGEVLTLQTADGRTMHSIRYSDKWYDNPLKKSGGWTLEMIDANNHCQGMSNWKASTSPSGGTPGKQNAVMGSNPDLSPPVALRAYAFTDSRISIVFNEPLDSSSAVNTACYKIDRGITVNKTICLSPLFDEVILETEQALDSQQIYTIQVNGIRDCSQNGMENTGFLKAGLFVEPSPGNLIINEILFNPRSGGDDYVEIFNAGSAIIDAGQLYLAGRNANGQVSSTFRLTLSPFAIYPGDYIVVSTDLASLSRNYLVKEPLRVLELASMPSYPDDKGTVVLLDFQGNILDEVPYDQDWHHKLISDPDGVSLERIDPLGSSRTGTNWHSAASTAGYGTPGYRNSQFRLNIIGEDAIEILPKVFSPDNDGHDDITRIAYKTGLQGVVANVIIFDGWGRQVKHLVRNELLGTEGYWNWNGLDEHQQPLSVGIYIIQIELFDLKGVKQRTRKAVVLAKNLN